MAKVVGRGRGGGGVNKGMGRQGALARAGERMNILTAPKKELRHDLEKTIYADEDNKGEEEEDKT